MTRPPFSPEEAQRLIRERFDNRFTKIHYTAHARVQMAARKVETGDTHHVFRTGTISEQPEFDFVNENWKYRIEGKDLEGEDLALIISLDADEDGDLTISLITVF